MSHPFRFREKKQTFINLGGCGGNLGKRNILRLNPETHPNVSFVICNTDQRHLDHILSDEIGAEGEGRMQDERIKRVKIGGNEVAMGDGSGADTEVGFRAAQTEGTMREFRTAIDQSSMVQVTFGLGKGTGTTASQVVAQICNEVNQSADNDLRKICIAIAIMPKGKSGQGDIATPALGKIIGLMPTVTVYNSKIRAYAKTLGEGKEKSFTLHDANDAIHDEAIRPMTDIFLENTVKVGDIASDQNDLKTMLKEGHNLYIRDLEFNPDELEQLTPEVVAQRLFTANFQEVDVAKSAVIASLWCAGYPYLLQEELEDRLQELSTEYNPSIRDKFRIIPNYREKLMPGEKGRIIYLTVAKEVKTSAGASVPEKSKFPAAPSKPVRLIDDTLEEYEPPVSISVPSVVPPAPQNSVGLFRRIANSLTGKTSICYKTEDNKEVTVSVPYQLAERYNNLCRLGGKADPGEWQRVSDAISEDQKTRPVPPFELEWGSQPGPASDKTH